MIEHEYCYTTFIRGLENKFSFGEYANQVASMHRQLMGPEDHGFRDSPKDLLDDLEAFYEDFVAGIVVTDRINEAVAFATLSAVLGNESEMELSYAYVQYKDRRKGIYKQLLDRRIDIARRFGALEVRTQLLTDTFHPEFILKKGFLKEPGGDDPDIYRLKLYTPTRVGDNYILFFQPILL